MKIFKGALMFFVLGSMILSMSQLVVAGRFGKETPVSWFVTDSNAPGTKISGTMALYYEYLDENCPSPVPPSPGPCGCDGGLGPCTKMTFFMRLEVGNDFYGFGGVMEQVCYDLIHEQQLYIEQFISDCVVSKLIQQGALTHDEGCYVGLTKITDVVEDNAERCWDPGNLPAPNTKYFTLLSFTIAVGDPKHEKCFGATDDDGDGYTELQGDCDDTDPQRFPNNPIEDICGDNIDNDCDYCDGVPEICDDGKDNDCDGWVDCEDASCIGQTGPGPSGGTCEQPEATCDDGYDNDGDGLIDCNDSDCTGVPPCPS